MKIQCFNAVLKSNILKEKIKYTQSCDKIILLDKILSVWNCWIFIQYDGRPTGRVKKQMTK